MHATQSPITPASTPLHSVIEPLVSYICAAEQPRATLASALRTLLREVEQTNQAARRHLGGVGNSAYLTSADRRHRLQTSTRLLHVAYGAR
jgi:hypothetical protein